MGPAAVRYAMKPDGEPDAGNRHVRFDERGWKTERLAQPQATASILDSTRSIRATGLALLRRLERHQLARWKIIDAARLGKSRHAQVDDFCGDVLRRRQRHRVLTR